MADVVSWWNQVGRDYIQLMIKETAEVSEESKKNIKKIQWEFGASISNAIDTKEIDESKMKTQEERWSEPIRQKPPE